MNKEIVNTRHFLGIDALRFFAAILVMWFHHGFYLAEHLGGRPNKASLELVTFPELSNFSYFGYVGVQIFFVISGFVIAFSGEKATAFSFFCSRVVRLGPGVWICASITLLATLIVGFNPALVEFRLYIKSILFVPFASWIDGAYWTLGIEISFYTMVGVLIHLGHFRWIKQLAIIIGTVSSLYWILLTVAVFGGTGEIGQLLMDSRKNRILDLTLVHHGLFFSLGVLLWLELIKKSEAKNIYWSAFFCLAGCLQIAVGSMSVNAAADASRSPVLACIIWLASISWIVFSIKTNHVIHRAPQWFLRSLKTAGLMTFPLYLIHQVAGNALMGFVVKVGFDRWTALCCAVFMTLFVSWIVATYLEPALQVKTKAALFFGKSWWAQHVSALAR